MKNYVLALALAGLIVLTGATLRQSIAGPSGSSAGEANNLTAIGTSPVPPIPKALAIGTSPVPPIPKAAEIGTSPVPPIPKK